LGALGPGPPGPLDKTALSVSTAVTDEPGSGTSNTAILPNGCQDPSRIIGVLVRIQRQTTGVRLRSGVGFSLKMGVLCDTEHLLLYLVTFYYLAMPLLPEKNSRPTL